jgi:hypothetical protein
VSVPKRYTVAYGWSAGGHERWYVESRNHRTVATCHSERMARRIARLLNEEADQ